ncbi:MAG: hypothetical protein ACLVI9_05765 [Anaerostipes hadrus]
MKKLTVNIHLLLCISIIQKRIKIVGINDMEIYDRMTPTFLSKYLDKINSSQYCVLDTNIPEESFNYIYENVNVPIIVKTTSINKDIRILQENMKIDVLVTAPKELEVLLNYYGKKMTDIKSAIRFLLTKNISHIAVYSVHEGFSLKARITRSILKDFN